MLCIRLYHKQDSADIVFDSLQINVLVLPVLIEVTCTDVDRRCFKARSNDRNIAEGAEVIRAAFKYSWKGDVIATIPMTFSSFGYYGQIWFNRAYTYECAVEEMPAGYADALMAVSPTWALPVVVISGILLSVLISNITAKLFKLEK